MTGAFTYVASPTITSVSPSAGPVAGGTTITIEGTNLLGAVVKIGTLSASAVTVNSAGTSLTATTPASTVGAKTVSVITTGGTVTKANAFTHVALPTITSVSPNVGPVAGGTIITIVGTNLRGATVNVGDVAANTVVVNAAGTLLTAKTPASTAGARTVEVSTAGGTAAKASAFTYVASLTDGADGMPTVGEGSDHSEWLDAHAGNAADGHGPATTATAETDESTEIGPARSVMLLLEAGATPDDCHGMRHPSRA